MLGIGVFGMGLGMVVPAVMTKLTGLVPFELATKVIGVGFLGMGVGGFIQPMVFAVSLMESYLQEIVCSEGLVKIDFYLRN